MYKTWVAAVVLLSAASAASAGPWSRQGNKPTDAFGADYLARNTAQAPPATTSEPPANVPAPVAGEPLPAPVPADQPAAAVPGPAPAASGPCPCCPTGAARGSCWHQLVAYFSYCPLHKGVNCAQCCGPYYEPCCCYHCFPSPYLFFLGPCAEGHAPVPPPYCPHPLENMFHRLLHHEAKAPCGCNCGS